MFPELDRGRERFLRVDGLGWRFVRGEPPQDERHTLTLRDRERRYRPEILALVLDRRTQEHRIRAGDRDERPVEIAHPRHDRAVVEADHELHPHLDATANPFDDPHEIRLRLARRHEVDEANRSAVGLELGLEDEGVVAIPAARRTELARRLNRPVSVLGAAEKRGEERSGVEAGKAEPVDRTVSADEGRRLEVADQPVVLDERHYCSPWRKDA